MTCPTRTAGIPTIICRIDRLLSAALLNHSPGPITSFELMEQRGRAQVHVLQNVERHTIAGATRVGEPNRVEQLLLNYP